MTNAEFVANVKRIADSMPSYRTGGDGSDGTCDCIGLVMGAVQKEYPMHSTNYFARFEVDEMVKVEDAAELLAGDLVFKTRSQSNPRYDLHERYREGGRYYKTGDLLDYYHVGAITSVHPLEITHCTQSNNVDGIAYDTTLDGWTHVAKWTGETEDETNAVQTVMRVYAENQKPVRMRKRPDTSAETIIEVPVGELVQVLEEAAGWAKIRYINDSGYMMREFLKPAENNQNKVTIVLDAEIAAALAAALAAADMM